jgi:hypothetical protein
MNRTINSNFAMPTDGHAHSCLYMAMAHQGNT